MDVRTIITHLNISEHDLTKGTKIYEAHCTECGESFGYILIPPTKEVLSKNVVVKDGYDKPEFYDYIKCLACHKKYPHAMDLFTKKIYEKKV